MRRIEFGARIDARVGVGCCVESQIVAEEFAVVDALVVVGKTLVFVGPVFLARDAYLVTPAVEVVAAFEQDRRATRPHQVFTHLSRRRKLAFAHTTTHSKGHDRERYRTNRTCTPLHCDKCIAAGRPVKELRNWSETRGPAACGPTGK
jgi:hypothetical protein